MNLNTYFTDKLLNNPAQLGVFESNNGKVVYKGLMSSYKVVQALLEILVFRHCWRVRVVNTYHTEKFN